MAKKINSKQKGKRGELEWSRLCQSEGYKDARRTAQFCGKTGDASDCVGLPGIHQEVKRVERLHLEDAMCQAVRDAEAAGKGDLPIVAHRGNDEPWKVTMLASDWFKLYREYEASISLPSPVGKVAAERLPDEGCEAE